jgi:endonuclease III
MATAKRTKVFRGKALAMHVKEVVRRLKKAYPDAKTELDFTSPWQLLVATILSAQSTDKTVNLVTPGLFARFPTPAALADANPAEVETVIKSTGFFRNKTKSIVGAAKAITEQYGGAVPGTMAELVGLPGVGRKTANVVLGNAFDTNEGIVVDTHVTRLSKRLGLSANTDAVKIELDLMPVVPKKDWTIVSHLLIFHGRRVCFARKPNCAGCVLADICPSAFRV